MAWLRAGTVAVTNGSTTVTGTNTGFAANTRVGDAFIGPDGRQYELQNVASDTVISILPAYLGPTASGQPYAVMPVQGYQKLLADLVRDWTNQYGVKMAALGSTGNYDVLPVEKGGTGGTDQASGRAGLGLGAVATDDVLTIEKGGTSSTSPSAARAALGLGTAAVTDVTSSSVDETLGRVLRVGDFGVGAISSPYLPRISDSVVGGTYRFDPESAGIPTVGYGSVHVGSYDKPTKNFTKIVVYMNTPKAYLMGSINGSAYTPAEFYTTANTTRGSGGALSAASPIVRIANVSQSKRLDLFEQTFEAAGEWGAANDEARGVIVERAAVGVYVITGSQGLALEGWRVLDPCSPDGGRALGITESEEDDQGAVTVRLFKQRWTLDDDGEMHLGKGAPLDVPLNSWIDVRLHMPSVTETLPT
ncbi:phage tail fiber protein [Pseudomonas protegens]|uniref:phage tail fiber protein n=1 Tax=Pseudomonas protegens TaxID=380021 RepID=UPI0009C2CB1D|nr:hypothetical protein [Pseudomonas protegens]AQT08937.1 phage tail fiber protein [Pseudomonas protegens]GED78329.1 hypothetical protein PFL02_51790 [Pseudomonas fluorescens]